MIPTEGPFVLLDDARTHGASPARLYKNPVEVLTAHDGDELSALLVSLRQARQDGLHAAGFFGYEAGAHLLPGLTPAPSGLRAWFGLFNNFSTIDAGSVTSLLPDPAGVWMSELRPGISRDDYSQAFARVQEYIRAGDIYQANLTFPLTADYSGDPLALYAALRGRARAGYGGVIWTGQTYYLSFSPELFFALKDQRITTKPMKGTAPRLTDPVEDAQAAEHLRMDPKQRAENLMIVDLLRNDLSRVCIAGSVKVPELFHVESYPTVHQMTSTVTGVLADAHDAIDVIQALFPCGSITGAPKIRAMQVVDEVEATPRGLYCGSIGRIDNNGDAAFNVAIRTFTACEVTQSLSLGLGSGVVADSVEGDEWAECLAKGDFAKLKNPGFDLIETIRFEPATGILRLDKHLERMKSSAAYFGFEFDWHELHNRLQASICNLKRLSRIRLMVSQHGAQAIEIWPLEDVTEWRVGVVPLPVDAGDFRLRHKISDRAFYDDARRGRPDCDEVVFVGRDGLLTEGSITALFVECDGQFLTPRLETGLLPSILRRELIEAGKAKEADLRIEDLSDGFWVGNSLRGLIRANRVA
ncbi:MAG: aminodeoxychorismate synthase component I [Sphingomonadaceae bacterium]|uniref:aminodeoxychorismate synthase component I n=1 Tax=Sphingorhabdus sp. TaxID=1902408 RepID=UPI002FD8912E|nr:aminodeoxychorismate synthase component I [Sphingomonadaceae bacterium]